HFFASLLVIAANDCRSATSDLAHHATWRRRVRLGGWWRDILNLVASWRVPCASRCVDDLPKRRRAGTTNSGRLDGLSGLVGGRTAQIFTSMTSGVGFWSSITR